MAKEMGRWKLGLIILEDEERKLEIVVAMVEESSIFGRGGGSLSICSIELKDGIGGEGLVVVGGRAGGREVKGGGVDLGVTKSLLGETLKESGGEEFEVDGGAV
nr:hypothetical protein [Tanacetum cinerariifolium]